MSDEVKLLPCENTDCELWREQSGLPGDSDNYYAASIHVTARGGIGINVGGTVIVKTLREWHSLATRARIRRDSTSELLDQAYGTTFTIRVGWNDQTSIHTQSGFLADPTACLTEAIEALQEELARASRCPRASAIEARRAATENTGAVHESAVPQGDTHE